MNERERQHDDQEQTRAAGDAAIDEALSSDSTDFLRSTRQHGGQ
jgi:hypothetical protein